MFIENTPRYIIEKRNKYYIQIGYQGDDFNNILDTSRLNIKISSNLSMLTNVSLLESLLINENDDKLNVIIFKELFSSFLPILIKIDNELIGIKANNQEIKTDDETLKSYIYILRFINYVLFKFSSIKIHKYADSSLCIEQINKIYLENDSLYNIIIKENLNEQNDFSLKLLYDKYNYEKDENNFIVSIKISEISKLKNSLLNFKKSHYNIDSICYDISNSLTVNHNHNELSINQTPFIKNSSVVLPLYFADDYFHLSMNILFRSVGISLNKKEAVMLSLLMIYSKFPINDLIKNNWIKSLRNNTNIKYIYMFIINNHQINFKLYNSYLNILFYQNQNLSKTIFDYHYDDILLKIKLVPHKNVAEIMILIFMHWFLDNIRSKRLLMNNNYENFTQKIGKFINNFPFINELKSNIIRLLWTNRYNLKKHNNQSLTMLILTNTKLFPKNNNNINNINIDINDKNFEYDNMIYFNNFQLIENETNTEENEINKQVHSILKSFLFKSFMNTCELCDELHFCDTKSNYILDCENHKICYKCSVKLYNTNNYTQGSYIEERHFTCPFCRFPEKNKIFKVPDDLYMNINNHRLCSYVNCLTIVKADGPRICELNNNSEDGPIYCERHHRIIRIMSQFSNHKKNSDEVETKICPNCNVSINKIEGCNHIKCNCSKEFCWVCDFIKPDNVSSYNHPSYCRGNKSWEEGLITLKKFIDEIYKDIYNTNLLNIGLHDIYSKMIQEMFSSPEINANSFWDLTIWLNKKHNEPDLKNFNDFISFNISNSISNLSEWIHYPFNHDFKLVITNLNGTLNQLSSIYPNLFIIPESFEVLQYD